MRLEMKLNTTPFGLLPNGISGINVKFYISPDKRSTRKSDHKQLAGTDTDCTLPGKISIHVHIPLKVEETIMRVIFKFSCIYIYDT
jgi:hypothetical protein